MKKVYNFKIKNIDEGFCRITYITKNVNNQTLYYCLQDDGGQEGISFYRCSQEMEPEYRISTFSKTFSPREMLEPPAGESKLEIKCREWINSH